MPGVQVELYQIAETLSSEILTKMHAPPKSNDPIITPDKLAEADGVLFGFPTRFGMMAAQAKAFWDATGGLWRTYVGARAGSGGAPAADGTALRSGGLVGKPAGIFYSTATQNGGQETTALTAITQLTHHGMVYVPIGYSCDKLFDLSAAHGGSPYGAGTLAGGDGSRQPSELERAVAEHQGEHFAKIAVALKKGRS